MNASGLNLQDCHNLLRAYVEQSLEILTSIEQQQKGTTKTDVSSLLHKLKGSSGNVRANAVMEQVLKAESAFRDGRKEEFKLLISQIYEKIRVYDKFLSAL